MPETTNPLDNAVTEARNDIRTDKLDITYGELASMYDAKELVIRPEYQRLFRWTDTQKFRFVESILLGFPTPAIFVAEDENGIWELVDGLQRVSTVLEFMGRLKSADGAAVPPSKLAKTGRHARLEALDDKRFEDLSLQLRLSIKRAGCRVEVIKVGSQPTMKYDVFERLNTGGSELTPQEVRNCIFRAIDASFMEWVDGLAAFGPFASTLAEMSENQTSTMYDRGLVLRYFVIKNAHTEFDHDVEPFITDYFRDVLGARRNFIRESEGDLFKETFSLISGALGADSWKHYRNGVHSGPISVYVFEAISTGVAMNVQRWRAATEEQLKEKLISFKEDRRFVDNTGPGANTKAKLLRRVTFGVEYFGT